MEVTFYAESGRPFKSVSLGPPQRAGTLCAPREAGGAGSRGSGAVTEAMGGASFLSVLSFLPKEETEQQSRLPDAQFAAPDNASAC